jgi:hypothetical protein
MYLDFLQPFLDSRITFSRGTGATRVNASGFIEVVGNTTPRFDYDPVTLAPRGLLIEEARTNLLTYSEQFDNAAWVKVDATITANTTVAPDGTTTADTWSTIGATYPSTFKTVTVTAGVVYTLSVYAKSGSLTTLSLEFRGSTSAPNAKFNLANGTVTSGTGQIQNAGNGWYRCSISVTSVDTSELVIIGANDGTVPAGTIFLWGAQLEAGAFATSYIPTVASTVSRSADVATMTGTNFSSWWNATQGTFVVDADTVATGNRIIEASAGSLSRVVDIYAVSGPTVQMWNGTTAYSPSNNFTLGSPFKVAGAYQTANYAVVLNGGTVRTDAAVLVNTADSLQIGRFSSGTNYLNGHIRAIAYYNTRLPNTQLQTLTAPSLASPLALDFISPTYTVGY